MLDLAGYPGAPDGAADAFLKPETVHTAFAHDLPEADRWTIVATQRPASLVANVTPSAAPAWKSIPSWEVLGTDDLVIPIATQRKMAERRRFDDHRSRRNPTYPWCRSQKRPSPRSWRPWTRSTDDDLVEKMTAFVPSWGARIKLQPGRPNPVDAIIVSAPLLSAAGWGLARIITAAE